jgi:hypothetical protein
MGWRKSTWAFVLWTGLVLLWMVSGASKADCQNQTYTTACQAGLGIGLTIILFIWFLVAVPMSIIWYATKPKGRTCPACGSDVKVGLMVCQRCGFNFAAAAMSVQQTMPPPPSCPRCRTILYVGQTPCPQCGQPIGWGSGQGR